MSALKRIFLIGVILFVLLAAVFFILLPHRVSPDTLEQNVVRQIESATEGTVQFERFHLSTFPWLCLKLEGATLGLKNPMPMELKARQIKIYFRFLPAFTGRFDVSKIAAEGGSVACSMPSKAPWPLLKLENIDLKAKPIAPKKPIHFEIKHHLPGIKKAFEVQGQVTIEDLKKWNLSQAVLNGRVKMNQIPLKMLTEGTRPGFPFKIEDGILSGALTFQKARGISRITVDGALGLKNVAYQIQTEGERLSSPPLTADMTFDLAWDPGEETLQLKSGTLVSPIGKMELTGQGHLGTGEIREVNFRATGVPLESIPQYAISLKDAIPFNLGFSGPSDWEISLKGSLDHLSTHANVDFTQAFLTYARYFSKPKDTPMNLSWDSLLKDGKILSGDFSLRLLGTTLKGTLADFDLGSGMGTLNLITNKFELNGWQAMIIPFEKYQIGGQIKIFANFMGNLRRMNPVKPMVNITLTRGKLASATGHSIHNAYVTLDYGPVGLEVKEVRFRLDDNFLGGRLKVYNLPLSPVGEAKIKSPRLEPLPLILAADDLMRDIAFPGKQVFFQKAESLLGDFFPEKESVEHLSADLDYKEKRLSVTRFHIESYGGAADFKALLDFSGESPSYEIDGGIDRLSLARFLARGGREEKLVDGNLFLKLTLDQNAVGRKDNPEMPWTGRGVLSLTNGEFYTFDLLQTFTGVEGFSSLEKLCSGRTPFHDIRADLSLKHSKIMMDKIMLVSDNYLATGSGEMSLNGILNYRLGVYLSAPLTDEYLAPLLSRSAIGGDKRFGPVPMLLAGSLGKPALKLDPELLPPLLTELKNKKTQKIFRNFLPEDFLLDRRPGSN